MALTPVESMTTHDIVSPHDYSMEPFEKITDYEVGLLQTSFRRQFESQVSDRFLRDFLVIAFAYRNHVKKRWKRLVSLPRRGLCMMNRPLKCMKGDFKENCTLLLSSCHGGGPWLFAHG